MLKKTVFLILVASLLGGGLAVGQTATGTTVNSESVVGVDVQPVPGQKPPEKNDYFYEYVQYLLHRNFMIDSQKFSRVTCKVEASNINALVGTLRQFLEEASGIPGGGVEVGDFFLNYTRNEGVSFSKPSLEMGNSPEGTIGQQIDALKQQFDQHVAIVVGNLTAVFAEWTPPVQGEIRVTSFSEKDGKVTVIMEDGSLIEEKVYEGNKSTSKLSGFMTGSGDETYLEYNGHRVLNFSSLQIEKSGELAMNMVLNVEFQKVGDILFPKKIIMGGNSGTRSTQVEMDLNQCSVQ